MQHPSFALAAVADLAAVLVHGVLGHRALLSPLRRDRPLATRAFGDADVSWRVLAVAWHVVTATFVCSGAALLGLAAGTAPESAALPRFLSALHASFLIVGVSLVGRRALVAFRRPIPIAFAVCMTTACVAAYVGAR
jgi:hypothetical protein